jgi:hypothetical protein
MIYCPNRDQNWETLSAREAGFKQEKVSGLIVHIVSALA